MTSKLDQLLLYRLCYEPRQEQVVGDYDGNCSSVNVKGAINCMLLALLIQMIDHRINSVQLN